MLYRNEKKKFKTYNIKPYIMKLNVVKSVLINVYILYVY